MPEKNTPNLPSSSSGLFLKDDGTWAAAGGSFAGDMDDIPNGAVYVKTENNYTDADAAIVAATSGTNTGDQDLSGKQNADAQLTSIAGLAYTGNALKVVRVNAGETDFELATVSGGSGLTQSEVLTRVSFRI